MDKYIQNSAINGKLCRFNKKSVNIFITKISAAIPETQKSDYYEIINRAAAIWNEFSPVTFLFTETQANADIAVIWTKAGIKFEGMCKYRSIIASEIRSVTIEIGLPNPNSPKKIDRDTILHTALHELGHSLGLGHGTNENDVMFVPHTKTLSMPSDNDIAVLNFLYSNPAGMTMNTLDNKAFL